MDKQTLRQMMRDADLASMSPQDLLDLVNQLDNMRSETVSEYRSRRIYLTMYVDPSETYDFQLFLESLFPNIDLKVSWKGERGYVGTTTVSFVKKEHLKFKVTKAIEASRFAYGLPN